MDDDLLKQLAEPDAYPHRPASIEIIQTHISVVCIAGDLVYKLKKPVALPFLDFSTAPLRKRACQDELRLNRRLCPSVYQDVVPLSELDGRYRFAGPGRVVDHAVLMERLPQDRMMADALERGEVREDEVREIARVMQRFHASHRVQPGDGDPGSPDHLVPFIAANFRETEPFVGDLFEATLHQQLEKRATEDSREMLPLLRERAGRGHVVDGHGDLHARNICLTRPPAIYDCIEFSDELRLGDTATENAFLVMDLLYRGRRELAETYVDAYCTAAKDDAQRQLLMPLVRYRAMVRAKVSAFATRDESIDPSDREAAAESAIAHLRFAADTTSSGAGFE